MDEVLIPSVDDNKDAFKLFQAMYDAPAYVRRARATVGRLTDPRPERWGHPPVAVVLRDGDIAVGMSRVTHLEPHQADHGFGQVVDLDGLVHVEDEHVLPWSRLTPPLCQGIETNPR